VSAHPPLQCWLGMRASCTGEPSCGKLSCRAARRWADNRDARLSQVGRAPAKEWGIQPCGGEGSDAVARGQVCGVVRSPPSDSSNLRGIEVLLH